MCLSFAIHCTCEHGVLLRGIDHFIVSSFMLLAFTETHVPAEAVATSQNRLFINGNEVLRGYLVPISSQRTSNINVVPRTLTEQHQQPQSYDVA